jgi:hypothetical protein
MTRTPRQLQADEWRWLRQCSPRAARVLWRELKDWQRRIGAPGNVQMLARKLAGREGAGFKP